jgi:endoglucanase
LTALPARRVALVAALLLLLALALPSAPAQAGPRALERIRAASSSPFATMRLAVDPTSASAVGAQAARQRGEIATADALDVIAQKPQAAWFGDWNPTDRIAGDVAARVGAAARVGRTEVLVLYAIPFRDCGGFSAGGLSAQDYRRWVREVARGIGGRRTVVVLEPDALALLDCLSADRRTERLDLLRDAVGVLVSAGALLYVDAGHARWVPTDVMAERLRGVGVSRARGVSLNVSGFGRTEDQAAYAGALAARLPGLRAVVDTSRNGNGPADDAAWCNPPGRALGVAPRAVRSRVLDALLWIKRPGESDGECGRGEPPAGTFWTSYAIGLVAAAG